MFEKGNDMSLIGKHDVTRATSVYTLVAAAVDYTRVMDQRKFEAAASFLLPSLSVCDNSKANNVSLGTRKLNHVSVG
jgi:hypothetical protein